jgi:hypothetical protein
MTSRSVVFLALGIVASANSPLMAQPGRRVLGEMQAVENGWVFSLAQGQAQASKTGKPLMVVLRCVP